MQVESSCLLLLLLIFFAGLNSYGVYLAYQANADEKYAARNSFYYNISAYIFSQIYFYCVVEESKTKRIHGSIVALRAVSTWAAYFNWKYPNPEVYMWNLFLTCLAAFLHVSILILVQLGICCVNFYIYMHNRYNPNSHWQPLNNVDPMDTV